MFLAGLFSDAMRRNPYPLYEQIRKQSPVLNDTDSGLWLVFDYGGVRRAVSDHESFSSSFGPDWMIFVDPPRHTRLRALVSRAFTPRSIAGLHERISAISTELLDAVIENGAMDLAADYAVQLPMRVIAEMLGMPAEDRVRFKEWIDAMLQMSYTIGQDGDAARHASERYVAVTSEMNDYLAGQLDQRRAYRTNDLLARLDTAEIDGERLTRQEILGFLQLLLLAGSETTTNLINNAILCLLEHTDQLAMLRADMSLLPGAIEEVLRYRSPLQWMYRVARRDVELDGHVIPQGRMALALIGSANHDARVFAQPDRFDIRRDPNDHLAFGHGNHFCLGAPLARLEARIALTDLLRRLPELRRADNNPWTPRKGLHVHGPESLPIRFRPSRRLKANHHSTPNSS